MIELQDLANTADVLLWSLAAGEVVPPEAEAGQPVPSYSVVPLTVIMRSPEGEWTHVIDYLDRVRNLDRGVRIRTVDSGHVEDDEAGDYVEVTLTMEVYVMASAIPPASQPSATTP
jgi:hypothetical protein